MMQEELQKLGWSPGSAAAIAAVVQGVSTRWWRSGRVKDWASRHQHLDVEDTIVQARYLDYDLRNALMQLGVKIRQDQSMEVAMPLAERLRSYA
jgi:hypothetical protein